MCNEAFKDRPFREVCRILKTHAYEGIEIAPFTLAPDPLEIAAGQRREYRDIMADEGIGFTGLHWLLVTPKAIHVSTPDKALREESWRYVSNLIDLCADLAGNHPAGDQGDHGIMVFGSPKQRSSTGGITADEATRNFMEGLAGVAPHAAERGVTILMEALPRSQSDVVNTLAEAAAVVNQIQSPGLKTMFDSHNSEDETEPHDLLIERYFNLIRHIHVNEMDGRHPGTGDYDFVRIFRALKRLGYNGWISVEAFDFEIGGEKIASESTEYLHMQEELAAQ